MSILLLAHNSCPSSVEVSLLSQGDKCFIVLTARLAKICRSEVLKQVATGALEVLKAFVRSRIRKRSLSTGGHGSSKRPSRARLTTLCARCYRAGAFFRYLRRPRSFILISAQGLCEWHGVIVLRGYMEGSVRWASYAFVCFAPLISPMVHLEPVCVIIYMLQLY